MKHPRRWLVAVAVVALVAGGAIWVTSRPGARPVSVDEARDRLDDRTTVSSVSTAPSAPAGTERPAEGVYEYTGSGTERLSFPPLSQEQGPTMPGTVQWVGDDCWRFRIDYSTNHWQEWDLCAGPDGLEEDGGQTWQRWRIGAGDVTNLSEFTCDEHSPMLPTVREAQQQWDARCVGRHEAIEGEAISAGTLQYLGQEDVQVGATTIRTAHLVGVRSMSGAQQGSERNELWLDADTGLMVRNERTITVESDTPVGRTTYTETGEFQLASATPSDP